MQNTLSQSTLQDSSLKKLNKLRSKQSPTEIEARRFQRKQADTQSPELQLAWFKSMKRVLEEIDDHFKCVPSYDSFRFLDIGCCPGGFASYILSGNPNATGVGISLEVEKGGHQFHLEEDLRERFELKWADVTSYKLVPNIYDPRLQEFPFPRGSQGFDLVLLDGHPLRTNGGIDHLNSDRLLVSQLILGLWTVRAQGTLVVKLSQPEREITAQLLFMLDTLSAQLFTWKPVYMHATQPTFYAIAKGFGCRVGAEEKYWYYLEGLKRLWVDLTFSGNVGRRFYEGDLNFIVEREFLCTHYKDRLIQLSRHIWEVQAQSLKGWCKVERYR